jgi:glucose/arabinose dehydrogenase
MKIQLLAVWLVAVGATVSARAAEPSVVASGLKNPTLVCVSLDGRTFMATADGVMEVTDGKATKYLDLSAATGLVPFQKSLFVAAAGTVHRVDLNSGKAQVWAAAKDFPGAPKELAGMTVDERGTVYVAEANKDGGNALFAIGVKSARPGQTPARGDIQKVATLPCDGHGQYALESDGLNHVLALESHGALARVNVTNGKSEPLGTAFETGVDVTFDQHGRLFVLTADALFGIPRPGEKPVKVLGGLSGSHGIAFHPASRQVLLTEKTALRAVPAQIPGWEVDESPLPVETEPAFADVRWTDWDSGADSGRVIPLRPIVLTHANDGSGRTFVATQHGVIHSIAKGAKATTVFLDLQKKVLYKDNENEQGLLGLAFHPNFKTNGEFFLFYTDKSKRLENVVSRFKVSKSDPTKADPASEEELLRVSHKYWNHDGGTLAFGPDGFLYVVLGDGGSGNDPDDHGQKTDVLLGKILRLDVNAKGDSTAYAIPQDNPFVGKPGCRPEIYALGVRNPWRMSFDRKTGQGWFGEVGQNLFEEINLLEKGANYGWRRRESFHPFGSDGRGPSKEFTDPIWEYRHDVGKSITGGHVYRGKAVPVLEGYYLYADYVSGKVWGLKYDEATKKVTANRSIKSTNLPVMTFGEDEAGEVYAMTYSASGKGIYRFKATATK